MEAAAAGYQILLHIQLMAAEEQAEHVLKSSRQRRAGLSHILWALAEPEDRAAAALALAASSSLNTDTVSR